MYRTYTDYVGMTLRQSLYLDNSTIIVTVKWQCCANAEAQDVKGPEFEVGHLGHNKEWK